MLDLPSGDRLAVMISWEVFFGGRARDGVSHGGTLLLNPTNGSSYTGTILQTQQVASSRLRALENGRWVAQVAPTGFSAFVTPSGDVLERTGISEQAVRYHTVTLARRPHDLRPHRREAGRRRERSSWSWPACSSPGGTAAAVGGAPTTGNDGAGDAGGAADGADRDAGDVVAVDDPERGQSAMSDS